MLFVLLLLFTSANAYKILGVFPYPGKSHFLVFSPLMKKLAEKGHDVTVISHFPLDKKINGYTDVSLKDTSNQTVSVVDVSAIPRHRLVNYLMPIALASLKQDTCNNLNHPALKPVMSEKFDVILIEHFNTDCFLSLVQKLQAPFIGIASHIFMPWTNSRVANIDHPAYVPNHFLDFSDRMDFIDRVENTIMYLTSKIIHYFMIDLSDNKVSRKVFGDNVPDVTEIAKNVSMILVCTHFSLNRPRPYVPAIVEIGGLHIGQPLILPQNIDKWINESTEGVIYFSMGSMIKGHTFPEDKKQAFMKAFSRLGQRVLWKWENETMAGKPKNVMIQKWMPQLDILCNPNVKAFISHGGLLGITEAVHCGVPVIVMPQFGDQFANARALEASGGGVVLDFRYIDEETVYKALKTVLDPKFNKKAKELSAIFKDRPMSPMDTAIYWIEYVARHKGAHHLRTAAVGMPWYQYLLLDVIAFLLFSTVLVLYLILKVFKLLFSLCSGKPKVKKN